MFGRSSLVYLLAAALVCGGLAIAATGNATAAVALGVWQSPEQVPGIAALNVGLESGVNAVSCAAAGECSASGLYLDGAGHNQAFVVDERKGVWGTAQEVPGSGALNTGGNLVPNAISCASPGNCAVGGNYTDGSGNIQAWVADEAGGVWHDAHELPGTAALNTGGNAMVNSISCAAPGDCAAGGTYTLADTNPTATGAFVASEVNGAWSAAIQVPGSSSYYTLNAVSCGGPGDCVAGGGTGTTALAYLVTETSGTWGSAQSVAGTAYDSVTAVSCKASGCDAVAQADTYSGEGFGVSETGGTWGGAWGSAQALPVPVTIPSGDIGALKPQSLSCTSPGSCTAVGWYAIYTSQLASVDQEGFIAEETGGTWAAPQTVPSLAALDTDGTGSIPSVSCPAPGYCAATASYAGPYAQTGALLSEVNGTWGTAEPLSSTEAEIGGASISCGAVSYCSMGGGSSATGQYYQAIVVDETPVLSTRTTEAVSAPRVTYGHEQSEQVSVHVSALLGIVAGNVHVVSAGKTVCTITLADGKGSCRVAAIHFGPGKHGLTASYAGATGFAKSSSPDRDVAVAKARSKTTLTLSPARLRYGREQAGKLTVKVIPQYAGTPGGTVAITIGRVRVCVIALRRATGSCRLRPRTLTAGTYQVRATYRGSADFTTSDSAGKSLAITG